MAVDDILDLVVSNVNLMQTVTEITKVQLTAQLQNLTFLSL